MVKLVYWKYCVFPIRNKNISFYSFSGQGHFSLYSATALLSKSLLDERTSRSLSKGRKSSDLWAKRMVSTNRPLVGEFCQIEKDLTSYYQYFQTYYQENPQNDWQKLYPPAFYQQYFLKNMVE